MRKILIEIVVPAENVDYNIEVPLSCTAQELKILVCEYIKGNISDRFEPSDDVVLIEENTRRILNTNECLGNLGLYNGVKLILI